MELVPVHPAMVPMPPETRLRGKAAIADCRELLAKYYLSPSRDVSTGMADKHIKAVGPRKTALERSSLIADAAEQRFQEQQYREILKKRGLEHCA